MSNEPRFTEDEIAQMKREVIQIYQAENIALANRVADLEVQLLQWQELGARLVAAFEIERHAGDSDGISIVVDETDRFGGSMMYWNFDYKEDKVERRVALIRLLELLSATAQDD